MVIDDLVGLECFHSFWLVRINKHRTQKPILNQFDDFVLDFWLHALSRVVVVDKLITNSVPGSKYPFRI